MFREQPRVYLHPLNEHTVPSDVGGYLFEFRRTRPLRETARWVTGLGLVLAGVAISVIGNASSSYSPWLRSLPSWQTCIREVPLPEENLRPPSGAYSTTDPWPPVPATRVSHCPTLDHKAGARAKIELAPARWPR